MGFQVLGVELVVGFEVVVDFTELQFPVRSQEQVLLLLLLCGQQQLQLFLGVVEPLQLVHFLHQLSEDAHFSLVALLGRVEFDVIEQFGQWHGKRSPGLSIILF